MINIQGGLLVRDQHIVIFEEDEACFGNILDLAQYLGWEDTFGDSSDPDYDPDAIEESAMDFIDEQSIWVFEKSDTVEGELRRVR